MNSSWIKDKILQVKHFIINYQRGLFLLFSVLRCLGGSTMVLHSMYCFMMLLCTGLYCAVESKWLYLANRRGL